MTSYLNLKVILGALQMELIFMDQRITFDQQPSAELIINKINEMLEESYYFSYLIIDGVDIYDEFDKIFMDEQDREIQKIEVVAKTAVELVNDVLLTADNYIRKAIPEITIITDGFYNKPTSEHWSGFQDMLEGVGWIKQLISSIDQIKEKPMNWEEYLKLSTIMETELKNMLEALENADSVLIADIMLYELIPVFIELQKEINLTIDNEGVRTDVN